MLGSEDSWICLFDDDIDFSSFHVWFCQEFSLYSFSFHTVKKLEPELGAMQLCLRFKVIHPAELNGLKMQIE